MAGDRCVEDPFAWKIFSTRAQCRGCAWRNPPDSRQRPSTMSTSGRQEACWNRMGLARIAASDAANKHGSSFFSAGGCASCQEQPQDRTRGAVFASVGARSRGVPGRPFQVIAAVEVGGSSANGLLLSRGVSKAASGGKQQVGWSGRIGPCVVLARQGGRRRSQSRSSCTRCRRSRRA